MAICSERQRLEQGLGDICSIVWTLQVALKSQTGPALSPMRENDPSSVHIVRCHMLHKTISH